MFKIVTRFTLPKLKVPRVALLALAGLVLAGLVLAALVGVGQVMLEKSSGSEATAYAALEECTHQPPPAPQGYYFAGTDFINGDWYFVYYPYDPPMGAHLVKCAQH